MIIYEGKRIAKYKNWDLEKGDPGWLPEDEMPEEITRCRFFLDDVGYWQEYANVYAPFKTQVKKQILEVLICIGGESKQLFIIEDLEVFDLLMEDVAKQTQDGD